MTIEETPLAIHTPAPISCIAWIAPTHLCVGSDDGTVRFYDLPNTKAARAIARLPSEIASCVPLSKVHSDGTITQSVWVASGRRFILFDLHPTKLVMAHSDASLEVEVGEDEEDVINDLCLNHDRTLLGFCTDSGTAGVINLLSHEITRMRTRHDSICGSVKFIPDRPNELVSGGYDSALLHFDLLRGSLLSRFDIVSAAPPPSGVSLSPPFVQCMSVSIAGMVAVGTADGQMWIGAGGDKASNSSKEKKKRSRKWEGLKANAGLFVKVAEGPIIGVAFLGTDRIFACTLLGTVIQYVLARSMDGTGAGFVVNEDDRFDCTTIEKANCFAVNLDLTCFAVGGFRRDGRGLVEIYAIERAQTTSAA